MTHRWLFIRRPILTTVFLLAFTASTHADEATKPARIDPDGIKGSLVLCGTGDVSTEALKAFVSAAGGKQARVVIVRSADAADKEGKAITQRLLEQWDNEMSPIFAVFRGSEGPQLAEAMKQATGVWLADNDLERLRKILSPQCQAVLDRGGVIGLAGKPSAVATSLLPDSAILVREGETKVPSPLIEALKKKPTDVGYELSPGSTLVVRGRQISTVAGGTVTIHLAAAKSLPETVRTIEGPRSFADLTALRRSARARINPNDPTANSVLPVVEKGTLVIIGGGGMPAGMVERFVELAGGKTASIVILPTALDPVPMRDGIGEAFRKAGAKSVTLLRGRTLAEVDGPESLKALREATGIWFGGGRQWRFVDAYEGTKAFELMKDVLRRGGVIGGSSAGATIQGDYLCRGSPLNNTDIICEGYERGLAFLPGVAIDQHFTQRKRHADMTSLMKVRAQFLGIGIDEATAIVVRGSTAEVVGKGAVHFYDPKRPVDNGKPDYEAVKAGGSYDLKARKVLGPSGTN